MATCSICGKEIKPGEGVTVMGKQYHRECWRKAQEGARSTLGLSSEEGKKLGTTVGTYSKSEGLKVTGSVGLGIREIVQAIWDGKFSKEKLGDVIRELIKKGNIKYYKLYNNISDEDNVDIWSGDYYAYIRLYDRYGKYVATIPYLYIEGAERVVGPENFYSAVKITMLLRSMGVEKMRENYITDVIDEEGNLTGHLYYDMTGFVLYYHNDPRPTEFRNLRELEKYLTEHGLRIFEMNKVLEVLKHYPKFKA